VTVQVNGSDGLLERAEESAPLRTGRCGRFGFARQRRANRRLASCAFALQRLEYFFDDETQAIVP